MSSNSAATEALPLAGRGGLFLGREPEVAELSAGFEQALAGRGGLVLIAGEPGMGKTRLAEEFCAAAGQRGALVLWGACQGNGQPAYWPWRQLIRARVRSAEPAQLAAELADGAADLAPLVGGMGAGPTAAPLAAGIVEPEQARFRLFDSVTTFFKNVAGARPTVLVLEDLHWADDASLALLQFFARELRDARLLALATYRHQELPRTPPLARMLGELTTGTRLVLGGLSEPDVGRVMHATLQAEPPAAAVAAVHRHSAGNPFLVAELVRLIARDGRLPATADGDAWTLGIPQGAREVIGLRLDRLTAACNRVLGAAAVLGPACDGEALAATCGLAEGPLRAALDEAAAAGIVVALPGASARLAFAHELFRMVVYGELAADVRQELHARAAAAIERLYAADLDAHVAELAHHCCAAPTAIAATSGVDYGLRAGEQALRAFAYDAAIQHLATARARLPTDESRAGSPRACDVLVTLGQAQVRAGLWHAGRDTLAEAARGARALGDGRRLARAGLGIVNWFPGLRPADHSRAPLLREALALLGPEDGALRCQVMAELANEHLADDRDGCERQALSRAALDGARRTGDGAVLAHALFARFWVLFATLEDPPALVDLAGEVIELGVALGDRDLAIMGYNCRIPARLTVGDAAGAQRDATERLRLAERRREPWHRFDSLCVQASHALQVGRFAEAEALAPEIAAALGRPAAGGRLLGLLLFRVRFEQGRGEEVEPAVRALAERDDAVPATRAALAALCADLGRTAEASAEAERLGADITAALPRDGTWLTAAVYLATACAAGRDGERCAQLYHLLAPHASLHVAALYFSYLGSVSHYLGLLAAALDRHDAAAAHFRAALDAHIQMAAAPMIARTQRARAEMLLRRDRPGDGEAASALLDEALRAARDLGMQRLDTRIAALRAALSERRAAGAVFRRDGEAWVIAFQGRSLRLKDAKGLRDLAALLARPQESVHAAALAAAPAERSSGSSTAAAIDLQARDAYRDRVRELRREIDEAERLNDRGRGERAQHELDAISDELTAAYGLGGRPRRPGDPAERARAAVTMRIRAAVERIEKLHPALGRHLANSVRTGTWCSYQPEVPTRWDTDPADLTS